MDGVQRLGRLLNGVALSYRVICVQVWSKRDCVGGRLGASDAVRIEWFGAWACQRQLEGVSWRTNQERRCGGVARTAGDVQDYCWGIHAEFMVAALISMRVGKGKSCGTCSCQGACLARRDWQATRGSGPCRALLFGDGEFMLLFVLDYIIS